jgi:hypothetical protein
MTIAISASLAMKSGLHFKDGTAKPNQVKPRSQLKDIGHG